jgi:LmbE family N-acetylglucosaminyl deacetylase
MRGLGRIALRLTLALAASPLPASAKSILVVGPHPDDETMIAGGRTRAAVLAGDTVHVVVATNGDNDGKAAGLVREAESVAAARVLGVPEENVVFLGYGDQSLYRIWSSKDGTAVFKSAAGQTATYANRGLGRVDFHRFRTGAAGPYSRETALDDFKALITTFHPDEIYTVSFWDNHGDHAATAYFINEALIALKRQGADVRVRVFQGMVWPPDTGNCYGSWPPAAGGALPYPPFPAPPCIERGTSLDWSQVQIFPLPPEMQARLPAANLKWQALAAYRSQFNDFLASFIRKDEFFWRYDHGTRLSSLARVSVSSDYPEGEGAGANAIDGYADRSHEWKSKELRGAWIQLDWSKRVRTAQINLYDRLDPNDNVRAGTLSFSNGSAIPVGPLHPGGKPLSITFSPRVVTWVRFTIDAAVGYNAGLAELEVLGVPATSKGNVAPHVIRGPLAAPAAIEREQTSKLTVEAWDLDGDPLTYSWSADLGSVAGKGASAVFTPPAVSESTVCTVTVEIADGRGGVTSNSTFISVAAGGIQRPAPADRNPGHSGEIASPPASAAVLAAGSLSLTLAPPTAVGGNTVQGTVNLSTAAPAEGVVVDLGVNDPSLAAMPSVVTVAGGEKAAAFRILTTPVQSTQTLNLTVREGGGAANAVLTLEPLLLTAVALSPLDVVGGSTSRGTLTLNGPAYDSSATVQLSTTNSAAIVPAAVAVRSGSATATFVVGTRPVARTASPTIRATLADNVLEAALTVRPPALFALWLSTATVAAGGNATGRVELTGPAPAGGVQVSLSTDHPADASVPAAVTVLEGASSVTFPVSVRPAPTRKKVMISARLAGATKTATLTSAP